MIKRIAIAIVLLPVWFAVFWFLFDLIAFYVGGTVYSLANIFQLDVAGLYKNPPALQAAAVAAWERFVTQYGHDPQALLQASRKYANDYNSLYMSTIIRWATVFAAVGATIFSLSKVSDGMRRALLFFRRLITAPLVLGFLFPILAVVFVYLAMLIAHLWVGASTGAELQKAAHTDDAEQMKTIIQKPVVEAIQRFDVHYGGMVVLGALVLALIFTLFFTEKLVFVGWLPWCGKEATGSTGPTLPKKK